MKKECLQALKSLCSNSDILIAKPDKDSGAVIIDKSDYILSCTVVAKRLATIENLLEKSKKLIKFGLMEYIQLTV